MPSDWWTVQESQLQIPASIYLRVDIFSRPTVWAAMKWLEAIRRQESILGSYCGRITGFLFSPLEFVLLSTQVVQQKPSALSHSPSMPSILPSLPRHVLNHCCFFTSDTNTCSVFLKMAKKTMLPFSSKLLKEKRPLFTCTRYNVVFFMARTRWVYFIPSHLNQPDLLVSR